MLRKLVISILPVMAMALLLTSEKMSDNGRAGKTGSPNEVFCTDCHSSYALNSGGGSISLHSQAMSAFEYTPGQTYDMTVTVSRSANNLFGVDIEALTAANDNAGTLIISDAASTSIKNVTVGAFTRRNIVHTLNGGASAGFKDFNFKWTAPVAGTGNVTFYFSGIAADGNGSKSMDYVYASSQVISEQVSCSGAPAQPGTITGNSTVCNGSTITYSVAAVAQATSYSWTLPNGWTGTSTTNSINVTAGTTSGTISVTAINSCGTSPASSLALTINSLSASITSLGDTLFATPGASYEWYLNGAFIPGATGSYFIPAQNGNYIVVVYNSNGCSGTSPTFVYTSLGLKDVVNDIRLIAYPNPAKDFVILNPESNEFSLLKIYDVKGILVGEKVLHNDQNNIDVSGLSEGIYSFVCTDKNNRRIAKVLITH